MINGMTIHQKISLKGIISNKKERDYILSHKRDDKPFEAIYAIAVLWNYDIAIDFFLTNDINVIPINNNG